MSDPFVVEGARAILPGGVERVSVRVEGGRIAVLDGPRDGARVVDGGGFLLAAAMVDLHGDAFERQLMPRPGVMVPVKAALLETDRQLAANGIATAYHALTLGWEPGLRSVATAEAVVDALAALAPRLTVENRVQLRWETFCLEALPLIDRALAGPLLPSLAFNDHTSMAMLDPATPLQDRPFDHDPAFPVVDATTAAFAAKMEPRATRSGLSTEAFVALVSAVWSRRPEVPDAIAAAAAKARAAGAPMLSHDDSRVETRDFYRRHGARTCEFPMNRAVAEAAREAGDVILFGAPNAARAHAIAAINSKRVDMAVFDAALRLALVVEYQGSGHYRDDAILCCAIKREALRRAGVPMLEVEHGYEAEAVRAALRARLGLPKPGQGAGEAAPAPRGPTSRGMGGLRWLR